MEDFNDTLGSYLSLSIKQGVLCGATTTATSDSCLFGASGLPLMYGEVKDIHCNFLDGHLISYTG